MAKRCPVDCRQCADKAAHVGPECGTGKHGACHGDAWDYAADEPTDCTCSCHQPAAAA